MERENYKIQNKLQYRKELDDQISKKKTIMSKFEEKKPDSEEMKMTLIQKIQELEM